MRTYHVLVSKFSADKIKLGEVLNKATSLSLEVLADAAAKGALWHQRGGKGKILKLRNLHVQVMPLDKLILYFEPKILSLPELNSAECLLESERYGVWNKLAGVLPQGTQTGDHTSLIRYVEKIKKKDVFLVHRLDRETEGLMIIAYTSEAAARLSELFLKNKIQKTYLAVVKGVLPKGKKETINESLDGKEAITHFDVLEVKENTSLLSIKIDTGRLHQIRRHLNFINHPVMGDPKYGHGNKNREGLKLLASSLEFIDPWSRERVKVSLPNSLSI